MLIAVVYDSEFGNTRTLAEAIAEELRNAGTVQLTDVRIGPAGLLDGLDILVVGGPTHVHGMSQPMKTYLDGWAGKRLQGLPVAAFDTRVHGPRWLTGAASGGIARWLRQRGARLVGTPESFLVDGREGPLAAGEVERSRAWARRLLTEVDTHAAA